MNINRPTLYELFIVTMWLYIIVMPVTGMLAFSGNKLFFHFPKIPFILMVCLFVLHSVLIKTKIFSESILFLFFLPIALIIGFIDHGFADKTLSHLYSTIMPILSLSFGAYFCRQDQMSLKLSKDFEKLMKFSFTIYIFIFLLYFWMTLSGRISYWGLGVNGLIMVALFMLVKQEYIKFVIMIGIILISGKRSILVATVLTSMIVFLPTLKLSINRKRFLAFFLICISLWGLFVIASKTDLLRRFQLTAQFDTQDEKSMYMATGGRWQEYLYAIDYINKNKYWLWGGGFGSQYNVYDFAGEFIMKRHYSHLTPLSYILVYGSIFTFLLYCSLTFNVIKVLINRNNRLNFFNLMYIALFINSFFGAAPLTDPLMWFFLGYMKMNEKLNRGLAMNPQNQFCENRT